MALTIWPSTLTARRQRTGPHHDEGAHRQEATPGRAIAQEAPGGGRLAMGAKEPLRPIPIGPRRSRPSRGFVEATPEPLSPHSYPLKRASLGKRQEAKV